MTMNKRQMAKWIKIHPLQEDDGGAYMCSKCGKGIWDIDGSETECPFCGAYMTECIPETTTDSESENKQMYKKLADLTVSKSSDYYDEVVKALEEAGFLIVLEVETTTDRYYIVAKDEEKSEDNEVTK